MINPCRCLTLCCGVLCCVLLAGCPLKPENRVSLEEEHKASVPIGSEGGTIKVTASDGTAYALTIPPHALATPATITMTPVSAIADLPLDGGLAGGVDLQPAGLRFTRPASLTIATSKAAPSGLIPIGFSYEGDAETLVLAAGGVRDGALTVSVRHFSGTGIGYGTLQNVSALVPAGMSNQSFLAQLQAADPAQRDAVNALMKQWFNTIILPNLQNAANDAELAAAIGDYSWWKTDVPMAYGFSDFPADSPVFADERNQAAQAAAPQLRAAIAGNNDLCGTSESFSALANVLFWQEQASVFGVDTPEERLDRATVLSNLCVEIVTDPPTLPSPMQAGFPHSLDLRFGLRFKGHPEEQGAPFEVDMTATNATLGTPNGFTALDGSFTTVITAMQDGEVVIHGTVCLVLPGTTTPTDICLPFTVKGDGVDLTGTWRMEFYYSSTLGTGASGSWSGTAELTQIQNHLTGSFQVTDSGLLPISGHLSGTSITRSEPGALVKAMDIVAFELTQSCGASMKETEVEAHTINVAVDTSGQNEDSIGGIFDNITGCPPCVEGWPCGTRFEIRLERAHVAR